MAIVRCADCGTSGPHYTHEYVSSVRPVGGEITALVCGKPSCNNPGLIWLEKAESDAYKRGERIFGLLRNRAKVRAA